MSNGIGKAILAALAVVAAVVGLLAAQVAGKADRAVVEAKADKSLVDSLALDVREIRRMVEQLLRELPREQGRRR